MHRLNNVTTRMGPDIRDAIETMPGLGGVALWVKFADAEEPGLIAQTDGTHVYAGPRYEKFSDAERRFILLHELLHVALAHSARAREMEKRLPDFDLRLHNIAADGIINAALDGVRGIRPPPKVVNLQEVLTAVKLWPERGSIGEVVRQWSSEALYHTLNKYREQIVQTSFYANAAQESADIVAAAQTVANASNESESWPTPSEDEEVIRSWNARLTAARGSLSSVLSRLTRELPQVKTPWERILRDLLFRYAQRKRRPDPSRPTRRWLALERDFKQRTGLDLPFERATTAARTGRIALAIDTSGSVDEKLLARFVAEITAILERLEPRLLLIVCDAAVHQTFEFIGREGAAMLRRFKFKGGGGTDFRPAILEATKWQPDLLIYLTDLEGEAGNEPKYPVLWAVPEGRALAPWGRIIELN
jgi:predicted metal-dependent peptidase